MLHRLSTIAALASSSLLGLAALTHPVIAADLDYGDAPPPVAEQKVEFGSGWYIRGDIAGNQNYSISAYQPPSSTGFIGGIHHTSDLGYDLSLGGGYAFTNAFRGDITADFHQPDTTKTLNAYCYDATTTTCVTNGSFRNYDALANGYYDFGKWGILSPYVGAGVGVAFGAFSDSLTGGANTYGNSLRYHNLAWALMAGVSLDVYDHTKLDIGYRYLDDGKVGGTAVHYQEVRAGLRYMIDN